MSAYLCNNKDPSCANSVCSPFLTAQEAVCLMCGDNPSFANFSSYWTNGLCRDILSDAYYGSPGVTNPGITLAQQRANRVMEYMMGKDGSGLVTNGTDDLQNSLLEQCAGQNSRAPDACANYITNILVKAGYKYEDMAFNPGIADWLGCFLSPSSSEENAYDNLAGSINPSTCSAVSGGFPCYPMCNRVESVQRYDPNQKLCKCESNICVIDEVSIQAKDSSGNVNITQFCPSCTNTDPCTCILSSQNIQSDSTLSYTMNQYCGVNSTCYNIVNGILQQVNCQTLGSKPNAPAYSVAVPLFVIIIGIILFLIVLSIMFPFSSSSFKKKSSSVKETPTQNTKQN